MISMNSSFVFGKNSFPLNFHINENRIYLYDDVPLDNSLNKDQLWLHNTTGVICDIQISGRPTTIHAGDRHIGSSESHTLKYINHILESRDNENILIIIQENDVIRVKSYFVEYVDAKTIQCYCEVENISSKEIALEYVSSFCKYDAIRFDSYEATEIIIPSNSWFMECQWKAHTLEELGIIAPNAIKSFKKFCVSNTGAWSSKNYLPMAIIHDKIVDDYLLFQIESNGSWTYEIGDYLHNATLHISGPSLQENGWLKKLRPGDVFVSVKTSLTKAKSLEDTFKNITFYRRDIVKGNIDKDNQPIIFNEYMHASWNCPSDKTARELAPIAKKLGADYFVIDCGWHDEEENPFYYIGKWKESKRKYPNGLNNTLNYIRSLKLKVGLWLELEVVGCLGNARDIYDDDCFFKRDDKVLQISNRYQLDLRNDKVFNHLKGVIDEIMEKYNIDYFKFDYNIEPGVGSSFNSDSYGDALLQHNRRYHDFIDYIKNKYPNVIIESCASGGNRLDYLTLDNVNLCSTSDQDNYAIYPYIVANILSAVLPEQAGVWSYPVSNAMPLDTIDDECIIMNMVNSFVGRVHLASKLYLLDEGKQDLIKTALILYKEYNWLRKESYPYFPLGLAKYRDKDLAFGFRNDKKAILCVYKMKGLDEIIIPLKGATSVKYIYPNKDIQYVFNKGVLTINPQKELIARIFEITF